MVGVYHPGRQGRARNKLQRVVNISNKITGIKQSSLTALYENSGTA